MTAMSYHLSICDCFYTYMIIPLRQVTAIAIQSQAQYLHRNRQNK